MTALLEAPTDSLARECLYRFFALVLSDPRGADWSELADSENDCLVAASAELLRLEAEQDPIPLGFGERPAADLNLDAVLRQLARPDTDAIAEFDRVFGLVTFRECPPYESEYCSTEDPFFRAQQMADAAGFYCAFGLTAGRARPDRADHVALELNFMAHLLMMQRLTENPERAAICEQAAQRFFQDHLAWWIPSFASGLRRRAESTVYAHVADALAAFMPIERQRLGVKAPRSPVRPAGMVLPAEETEGCAGCSSGG